MCSHIESKEKITREVVREVERIIREVYKGANQIARENADVPHFDADEADQLIWQEILDMLEHDDWPDTISRCPNLAPCCSPET